MKNIQFSGQSGLENCHDFIQFGLIKVLIILLLILAKKRILAQHYQKMYRKTKP